MSVGQRGLMPAMDTLRMPHKKTNLSQILNPTAQTQALRATADYEHQRYQQYRNAEDNQMAQRWHPRTNNEQLISNPYVVSASRYSTDHYWEADRADISGQSPDQPTHDQQFQAPHVPADALLDQNHHHLSMFSGSEFQYSDRASTRIQARHTVEPPPNYNESYAEISEDYQQPQAEYSRKRTAPPGPIGPPGPKKAKKSSSTTGTIASKRGFTKKKRNEAEALRVQNAFLVPGVRYVNEKNAESSDNRMRMLQPEESASFGAGKLTPELQTARCMSAKYKAEDFPKCVSCTRRWAGDTCRFQGIRIFLRDDSKNLVGMSFVNNQKEEKPTMAFPKDWNVDLDNKDLLCTMRVTARQLLPVLHAERRHVDTQEIIYRPRECEVRATCDTCMTSLFCCSWMCRLCGRESCSECYEELVAITGDPNVDLRNSESCNSPEVQAQMASRLADQKSRKEKQNHSNPFFLACTKRQEHRAAEFTPVSRFCLRELDAAIKDMEAILKDEDIESLDEPRENAETNSASSTASDSTGVRTPPDLLSTAVLTEKDVGFPSRIRYPGSYSQTLPTTHQQPHAQPYVSQLQAAHGTHLPVPNSGYHQYPQQELYSSGPSVLPYHQSQPTQSSHNSYSNQRSDMTPSASPQLQSSSFAPSTQATIVSSTSTASTSSIPLYYPPSHCADVPLLEIPRYIFNDLTTSTFRSVWKLGIPILVTEVGQRFRIQWTPEYFMKTYGDQSCLIVECQTDNNKRVTVGDFFAEFGKYAHRAATETVSSTLPTQSDSTSNDSTSPQRIIDNPGDIWKLKDWPPSADFKTTFPELYEDFSQAVPIPNYVRRDGTLNIASHFPLNAIAPDLGPKMYNAMASNQARGSKGSTRLHMDMADAVNVMTYAADCPDGSPGCAAWDLFRAEDSVKLRAYLKEKFPNSHPTDPIHGQQVFLDEDMRKELADKWGVSSFRVYQRPGEAIFIPAGCAHQVCNLADCIKVAIDFVSPENVTRCEQLTKEFREQNQSKVWKEDILQLKSMMWFAWLSCSQQREERKGSRERDDTPASRSS
ncbi:hypothetical protein GYMLUDRAFT_39289 [Collybiopsis luxurians FD-317 M1]|nr:hypothetical protein GYMLUDRAFT_39289 [Collybiopsis luxurians FD-317 M1]